MILKKCRTVKYLLGLVFCLILISSCREKEKQSAKVRVPVIFDTDMGPDYDDIGAISILHKMDALGEAKILATVGSNKFESIASLLNLFNTYWREPDIPVGVLKGEGADIADSRHWSDTILLKFPHSVKSNEEVPDAVQVYREVLSKQEDTSVTIVTVGFLTNLANLLKSGPDNFSKLNGTDLVRKKVRKLVSMAGDFPDGREYNVFIDPLPAKYTFENWPTPVVYIGHEIGVGIKTGLPLVGNTSISGNPAKDAYRIALSKNPEDSLGRSSWDLITTLVAVRGIDPWFTAVPGKIVIREDGSNTWDGTGNGQMYLKFKKSGEKNLTVTLNDLMQSKSAL